MIYRLILIIPLVHAALLEMPSLDNLHQMAKFASEHGENAKKFLDLVNNTKKHPVGQQYLDYAWKEASTVNKTLSPLQSELNRNMRYIQKIHTLFIDVHKMIHKINILWKIFINHIKNESRFGDPLNLFILKCNGQINGGLQNLLEEIHRLIVPIKRAHIRNNAFLTMLEKQNKAEFNCDETISQQKTIHQIYSTLALTELRGYVLTVFSYKLLYIFNQEASINIRDEMDNAEARFVLRTQNYLVATREAMKLASNEIRRCDPKEGYKRRVTFAEFEGLYQTFIINEAHLAPDGECLQTCDTLGDETSQMQAPRKEDFLIYKKPCQGRIVKCWSSERVSICEMFHDNSRRYQWFKTDEGTYGTDSHSCPGRLTTLTAWLFWLFWRCDYCICNCEAEQPKSSALRTISLRESRTNVEQSMVMTGARIVQRNKVIHIQVRQGMLLPEGRIRKANQTWVPLEEFYYTYGNSDNDYNSYTVKKKGIWKKLKLGEDYEFIRSGHNMVNLDDVTLPQNYIATGVRFKVKDAKEKSNNPIEIEVLATLFNYNKGYVLENSSSWINSRQHGVRNPVKFNHPDIPTKYLANVPITQRNLYVKFQTSDLKKDAGQSTIPFWDTQEVITKPSSPLQGVGLFFKGDDQGLFGGFLALRIYTLDFTKYLNSQLPESMQNKYELLYPEPLYLPEDSIDFLNAHYSSYDEREEK